MTDQHECDDTCRHRLITTGPGCDHHYAIGQGYQLAWTVGPDGDAWPMLLDTRVVGSSFVPCRPEHFTDLAPHEQTGPLPGLGECGAPTRYGRPCSRTVRFPGDRCHQHQRPAMSETAAGLEQRGDRALAVGEPEPLPFAASDGSTDD
jgi:hypothetical protein